MQKSEDADIALPILLVLAAIVIYGVYHTYFTTPAPTVEPAISQPLDM